MSCTEIQNTNSNSIIAAHDYDRDGTSEIFTALNDISQEEEYPKQIQMFDSELKIIEQFNYNEIVRAPVNFLDLDFDGKDEILTWLNAGDSAYLDIRLIPDTPYIKFVTVGKDEYSSKIYST